MKNSSTRTMTAKRIAVAVAAVCATMSAPSFAAGDDMKALMDLLLKKGVITQQEYDQNIQAAKNAAEDQAFKEKRLADDVAKLNKAAEKNKDTGSVMKNGFGIQSADGRTTMQLTGRLHMDYRAFSSNSRANVLQDKLDIRRVRLGVKGQFEKDWKYEIVGTYGSKDGVDTEGQSEKSTLLDVGYADYAANPALQFRFGKFKMPFSLEQLGTSNAIDFMERSLANSVEGEWVPAKETGVMLFGSPMSGVSYGLALSKGRANTSAAADKPDTIGRVTANVAELMGNKDVVTHIGLGYSAGKVAGFAPTSGRSEAREDDKFFTSKVEVVGGATRTRQGLEAALAYDAFKVQSEFIRVSYDMTGTSAATAVERGLNVSYVQAVWNMTGEKHNYSNSAGTFGWIKPKQAFTQNGGLGAWQVGIRYSKLSAGEFATTTSFTSGAEAWTYGLTWFVNDNARMMLNYVDTTFNSNVGSNAGLNRTNERAVMARAQYWF